MAELTEIDILRTDGTKSRMSGGVRKVEMRLIFCKACRAAMLLDQKELEEGTVDTKDDVEDEEDKEEEDDDDGNEAKDEVGEVSFDCKVGCTCCCSCCICVCWRCAAESIGLLQDWPSTRKNMMCSHRKKISGFVTVMFISRSLMPFHLRGRCSVCW